MGRRRYQRPKVEKRTDVKRPYWTARVRKQANVEGRRARPRLFLGYCPTTTDPEKRKERGELTKPEAERRLARVLEEVNAPSTVATGSDVKLGEFARSHWIPRHVSNVGTGTAKKYRLHLKNHILPALGSLRLGDVTTLRIQDLVNDLRARGKSWHLRNDVLGILSSMFSKAQAWGFYPDPRNPCRDVELGRKTAVREKRYLKPDQVQLLIDSLDDVPALLVLLCDETGCRISEILGLQEKHIDYPEKGQALIAQRWSRGDLAETKNDGAKRLVGLGGAASGIRSMMTGDPEHFIFDRGDGLPLDDDRVLGDSVRPVLKALKLWTEGMGWHSFRRKAITEWQAAGASAIEAAKMAGHSKPVTTFDYTILDPERAKEIRRKRREVM